VSNPILKVFVAPIGAARVINPATGKQLPASGEEVIGNAEFWQRRVNDGDVTFDRPFEKARVAKAATGQESAP
jgi:uncharacterized membrane protein